jgi:2-keto-3-deoxy-L-rhamnonate aldolase RhmA
MNGGIIMKNDLKARLKNGEHVLGTMVNLVDNPEIAKIIKVCGFDYFIIDCEHGCFDYGAVASILAMAREIGICGMVRIPEVKREVILKYMEMGAGGLMLPNAESVEQAEKLVEHSKYHPLGNRGVSLLRPATGFEKIDNAAAYMQKNNQETVLIVQVESPKAVQNIDEILAVEGIDAAFIGPNDLTQSMGILGQYEHPDYIAAVDHVIAMAKKNQKFSGIQTMSAPGLEPWIAKGMTLNLWGSEVVIMMNAAKEGVAKFK